MPKHLTHQPAERSFRHKAYFLVALVLLVPIVPFVFVGWWLEPRAEQWVQATTSPPAVATWVVALLGTDILLPIPSSVISTLAGQQLGAAYGTLCSWLGMNISAVVGFGLARCCGRRWLSQDDDQAARQLSRHFGRMSLVVTRALPVLAEATVLHAGLTGMSWQNFLPPVLLSNLGISAAYAWLGQQAQSPELLALTLGVAAAAPLLLATWFRTNHRV